MTNEPEPSIYTLTLGFDLQQVSTALQFEIRKDGLPTLQMVGPAAGAYKLSKGDQVVIEIIASFDPQTTSAEAISVQDLILVSMPANGAHQADLSPFVPTSAGLFLQGWISQDDGKVDGPLRPPPSPNTAFIRFVLGQQGASGLIPAPLLVTASEGQWQVSGYLSVLVGETAASTPFSRVYGFDPTVIVGTGAQGVFLAA